MLCGGPRKASVLSDKYFDIGCASSYRAGEDIGKMGMLVRNQRINQQSRATGGPPTY